MPVTYLKKLLKNQYKCRGINFRSIKGKLYCDLISTNSSRCLKLIDVKKFLTHNKYSSKILTQEAYNHLFSRLISHETECKQIESIE